MSSPGRVIPEDDLRPAAPRRRRVAPSVVRVADRSTRRIQALVGVLVGAVCLVLTGVPSIAIAIVRADGALAALAVSVGMSVALGLSPWFRAVALAVAWLAAIVQMAAGLPVLPADVAVLGVLFAVGGSPVRPTRIAGLVSALVGAVVATGYLALPGLLAEPARALPVSLLLLVASTVTLLLAWTFGLLTATLRRARAARAQAAVAAEEAIAEQERGRIARDMHDVVAHSLAVIVAQADGARYLAGTERDRSAETLATVSAIAREALGDVRALLERLRYRQGELPQPGIDRLAVLVAQLREAGLDVELRAGAAPARVPAGTQLALYRIVQESLTNALRHGDRGRPALVAIEWRPALVRAEIRSALRAGATVGEPGHGLVGLRERARLAGGLAVAEPRGDEFVVVAELPLEPQPGGEAASR